MKVDVGAYWRFTWKLSRHQPIGVLQAQFYDNGDANKCYVTATFSSEDDSYTRFATLSLLLYEHQLITLADKYAKNLATKICALTAIYKGSGSLPPVLPSNSPIPNIPLVLSSKTVLLKKSGSEEYAVNFLPKFETKCVYPATVAKFLWNLLPWALTRISDDLRFYFLLYLDLLAYTALFNSPLTWFNSPLRRSDSMELILKLGWTLPGGLQQLF